MKNLILTLLLLISFNSFSKTPKDDSLKTNELILENQTLIIQNQELLDKIQNESKEEFIEKANVWITLGTLGFGLFGLLGVLIGLRTFIRNISEKYLKENVENGLGDIVQKKYGDLLKDIELKNNSKILVINAEGTKIPEVFKELMKEYPNLQYHDITKIEDINNTLLLNTCKLFDLIIIEDMVSENRWMVNSRNYDKINGGEDTVKKNDKLLVEFCKQVSPKSAVLYYGDGLLGKETIGDSEKEQYISFANAPATLLQNVFNLLKINKIGKNLAK